MTDALEIRLVSKIGIIGKKDGEYVLYLADDGEECPIGILLDRDALESMHASIGTTLKKGRMQ